MADAVKADRRTPSAGPVQSYDAVVIGAGQAGGPLAGALAKAGKRVALVEREHVGGTCVNVGCTPTKTMVASAAVANDARRAGDFGVEAGSVAVDMERVRARKREIVLSFRNGSQAGLQRIAGLDLTFGHARFVGQKRLEVTTAEGGALIEAEQIFVNVGTRPVMPDIPGVADLGALDSTTVMELDRLPRHLLVLGGGYVGVEFAQMFRRFGSEVTLVQRGSQILSREDPDVAAALQQVLMEDGIELLLDSSAVSARGSTDEVTLTVEKNGTERDISGSHLLVAAGRRPNTDDLGLDVAGVEVDEKGYIPVDDQLRTQVDGIWALGDIRGGPAFTHTSYDDYRIVRDRLLHGIERTVDERQNPYTVFTDPQLGRVGMTEREARASGRRVGVAKLPAGNVARGLETGNVRGVWKAVVDIDSEEILGAAILGHEGGEVMAVVQVAMMGKLSYKKLRDGVFAHPTYAESLNNLFTRLESD